MTSPKDKLDALTEVLQFVKETVEKRAPEGVDPEKHESCVKDVKTKGHDVGSAHAICTSSMKKEEGPDMASPNKPKGLDNKRKPVTHDECGRPFAKDETDDKIKAKMKAEMDKRGFGEADATRHIIDRDRGEAAPKPKEPLLQSELIKALDNAGHRESALLLKNWGELDKTAEEFYKSNYGPKDLGLYSAAANQKRKQTRTGDEVEAAGGNKGVRQYTSAKMGTAKQQAAEGAKKDMERNKQQEVKTYSPEELKTFAEARGAQVSDKVKKDDDSTLDYKKINPKAPKVDDSKAPTINYSGKEPSVSNPWKGSDVTSTKKSPKLSTKQESKESRISSAVKQGKVIDDRPKGVTDRVQKPVKQEAAQKPEPTTAAPEAPVKTAAQTLKERQEKFGKADINAKTIPDIASSADMAATRGDKLKDLSGVNAKAYSLENQKKIHKEVPKDVADLDKEEKLTSDKNGQWSLKNA